MTLGIMEHGEGSAAQLIQLEPLIHQVSGHSSLWVLDDVTVCKPLIGREAKFYRTLPPQMRPFTPEFRGTVKVVVQRTAEGVAVAALPPGDDRPHRNNGVRVRREEASSRVTAAHNPWLQQCHQRYLNKLRQKGEPTTTVMECILLENLTHVYRVPNVLDLKMGTRQYGDDAPETKRRSQTRKAQHTTTPRLGVRLAGMQVYNRDTKCYVCKNKYAGRELSEDGFQQTLRHFLHNGRRFRADIVDQIICKLTDLRSVVAKLDSFRFFTSSLLILYDSYDTRGSSTSSISATKSEQDNHRRKSSTEDPKTKSFDHHDIARRKSADQNRHKPLPSSSSSSCDQENRHRTSDQPTRSVFAEHDEKHKNKSNTSSSVAVDNSGTRLKNVKSDKKCSSDSQSSSKAMKEISQNRNNKNSSKSSDIGVVASSDGVNLNHNSTTNRSSLDSLSNASVKRLSQSPQSREKKTASSVSLNATKSKQNTTASSAATLCNFCADNHRTVSNNNNCCCNNSGSSESNKNHPVSGTLPSGTATSDPIVCSGCGDDCSIHDKPCPAPRQRRTGVISRPTLAATPSVDTIHECSASPETEQLNQAMLSDDTNRKCGQNLEDKLRVRNCQSLENSGQPVEQESQLLAVSTCAKPSNCCQTVEQNQLSQISGDLANNCSCTYPIECSQTGQEKSPLLVDGVCAHHTKCSQVFEKQSQLLTGSSRKCLCVKAAGNCSHSVASSYSSVSNVKATSGTSDSRCSLSECLAPSNDNLVSNSSSVKLSSNTKLNQERNCNSNLLQSSSVKPDQCPCGAIIVKNSSFRPPQTSQPDNNLFCSLCKSRIGSNKSSNAASSIAVSTQSHETSCRTTATNISTDISASCPLKTLTEKLSENQPLTGVPTDRLPASSEAVSGSATIANDGFISSSPAVSAEVSSAFDPRVANVAPVAAATAVSSVSSGSGVTSVALDATSSSASSCQADAPRTKVDIRLIDFAHATHKGMGDATIYSGPDEGMMLGLKSLINIFSEIKDLYTK